MVAAFKGWPEEAYDLLLKLEGEPSPAYLERHRRQRERLVRDPMDQLCAELDAIGGYGDPHVWNLHKNSWLWQHQCAEFRISRCVRLFLRFDLDGLTIEGGWSGYLPDQIARYRSAAADDQAGSELAGIVKSLHSRGYEPIDQPMKRLPRGYPPTHPRADLLRRRSLVYRRELGPDDWVHTPDALEEVRKGFDPLLPLTEWCTRRIVIA